MDFKALFHKDSVRDLLAHIGVGVGIILFLCLLFFFIYLPNVTNHGESITVPDLKGRKVEELEKFLSEHDLRFAVNDSSYSEEFPPLSVLKQFPKAGSKVKENRVIYISLNRTNPPTLPMPELVDRSLVNAEVVLKSNELKRGRIYYQPSRYQNLVLDIRYNGKSIPPNTRIPKGSTIDLVVGDGNGSADFILGDLVGDTYETALFKLAGWNLHLGKVQIPAGVDTTGEESFVYRQYPVHGDSVRVGDPVDLWIAPKGYKDPDDGDN